MTFSGNVTKRGLYITFEGPEGCGKSTQLKMLCGRLKEDAQASSCLDSTQHVDVVPNYNAPSSFHFVPDDILTTKEPGGIPQTVRYRTKLLDPKSKLTPRQESMLFWRDRRIHHSVFVLPALVAGKLVLGDRDYDSSWAYQHFARGLPYDWMLARENAVMKGFKPDLTLLYVGDVDMFLKRVGRRKATDAVAAGESRFDDEQLDFHKRVQEGFLQRAKGEPSRFRVLDGNRGIDDLFIDTYTQVKNFIDEKYRVT